MCHRVPAILMYLSLVGGKYGGRDLLSPSDFRVRPTAEPVRAAVRPCASIT